MFKRKFNVIVGNDEQNKELVKIAITSEVLMNLSDAQSLIEALRSNADTWEFNKDDISPSIIGTLSGNKEKISQVVDLLQESINRGMV